MYWEWERERSTGKAAATESMMANRRGFTVDESLVVSKLGSYEKKSIEAVRGG